MLRRLLAIALVLLSFSAFAQVDKGSIEAVASDQSKAPIPGVTVTATRTETGYQTVAVTDATGLARFPSLAPGSYDVEFNLDGFAPVKQSAVVIRVGQSARIAAVLQASSSETITVAATVPVVDVTKTDSSTNIVPEQIESLPVADRDFQRLAFIAPGVQRERGSFRFVNGGPVIGAGGNASQSTVLVNGVDLTDQVNGLSRARFSQDAVREFRVIANRFDTEIGGSAGGALSIVTKSGTNDIKGSVFGFFRDASLRTKGELELKKNDNYERRQLGFTVGGPFMRDRLFYFASVEQINEDNVVYFRPGGAYASLAADIDHPFDQTLLFGSADDQINSKMTAGVRLVHEKYDEENFRVGGVADEGYGQKLERRNSNATFEHSWSVSSASSNEARLQFGKRRFFEPTNKEGVAEWFSSGNTLQTGSNILGDLLGDGSTWEVRDTWRQHFVTGSSSHDVKVGASLQRVSERFRLDTYEQGLFIYITDNRTLPLAYAYGVGSSDVDTDTSLYGAFVEDAWRPTAKLLLNLGLRYDLDTNGNNAGFHHALIPEGRKRDSNNYQPRFSFNYDVKGDGTNVLRGGAGKFTGRFLLVPALSELQQNGETGRVTYTRINGALLGFPTLALDPAHPTTTGIVSKPAITLLAADYKNPEATQASVGYLMKLGSTRMFLDTEAIYVKGENEIVVRDVNFRGNATGGRPNAAYDQINTYTNDGHSKYKALVVSLNGNIRKSDLITASVTFSDKKNISDDFSPDFPTGYPNDPANIEAEYGRGRGAERYRAVLSGVFNVPFGFKVAPIFEYGSGQPWTHRLGYDYNGDGKNSDRPEGVGRNEEDGPKYKNMSLRLSKAFQIGTFGQLEAIAEGFNVLNFENHDVSSVNAAQYLSGPTLANKTLPYVANPRFGQYNSNLPAREFQLGVRWVF
jgi:hypothetical protein